MYLLSQNYQEYRKTTQLGEHSISRFKTQRRPFIRERTIETRIWQRIDYCVITKEKKIKRFVNCKHHNNCTRIN